MLKEERDLRAQIKIAMANSVLRRSALLKIGALIRAVREDDAKVAEKVGCPNMGHRKRVADAIRRR